MHQVRDQAAQFFAVVQQALDAGEQIVGHVTVGRFDLVDVAQADAEFAADLAGIATGADFANRTDAVQIEWDFLGSLRSHGSMIIGAPASVFLPSLCSFAQG